jgi:hypothetical protein
MAQHLTAPLELEELTSMRNVISNLTLWSSKHTRSWTLALVSGLLTIAYFYPSLIDSSKNAGFLYTGDIVGFYLTTIFKFHSLVHAANFQAIDYSLFNGSSDFFLSPNFYTFHPALILYSIAFDPSNDSVERVGRLIVLMMVLHTFIAMYFSSKLISRVVRGGMLISIFGGAAFSFSAVMIGGLFQPEFLFTITPLPWVVYSSLRIQDRLTISGIFFSSLPVVLVIVGGYIPLGIATLAIAAILVAAITVSEGRYRSVELRIVVFKIVRSATPFILGTVFCLPLIVSLYLYNRETSSQNVPTLFYSAHQLAESPISILRVLSSHLTVNTTFYEATITLGIIPLFIFLLYCLGSGVASAPSDRQTSVLKFNAGLYGATLLGIFGSYSVVSDFIYYFVPQVGKMHIYQRFLGPANLLLATTLVVMLIGILKHRPLLLIRVMLALTVSLLLAGAYLMSIKSSMFDQLGLNGFVLIELLAGSFFLFALLLPGRKFQIAVAICLVVLPGFEKMYALSDGTNTFDGQVGRLQMHLDANARAQVTNFIKANTSKDYVKYADLTPMWGPSGTETFPKQFPYLELDALNLSSFGGFTFYLSSRAEYLNAMPVTADVRLSPDWEALRQSGVDFIIVPEGDLKVGALAELVKNIRPEKMLALPNHAILIAVSQLQLGPSGRSLFDNGMFRVGSTREMNLGVNLALGKSTTQSSTISPPSLAVDGNVDGNFVNGSVSHTGKDKFAWLDVDLGDSFSVGDIRVWNRTDCCKERLRDFWLFVSDRPFEASDTPSELSRRPLTWSRVNFAPGTSLTIPTEGARGRYVRIQLAGSDDESSSFLHIAELEVFQEREPKGEQTDSTQNVEVSGFQTNFANHSAIDTISTEPVQLQYLFWPNPRTSFWNNGAQIQPEAGGNYRTFLLPPGENHFEARYFNPYVIAIWLAFGLYWVCLTLFSVVAIWRIWANQRRSTLASVHSADVGPD